MRSSTATVARLFADQALRKCKQHAFFALLALVAEAPLHEGVVFFPRSICDQGQVSYAGTKTLRPGVAER